MMKNINFFFSPSPFSSGSSTPSGIGESGSSVTNPEPRASSILAPTIGEFILILTVYTSSGKCAESVKHIAAVERDRKIGTVFGYRNFFIHASARGDRRYLEKIAFEIHADKRAVVSAELILGDEHCALERRLEGFLIHEDLGGVLRRDYPFIIDVVRIYEAREIVEAAELEYNVLRRKGDSHLILAVLHDLRKFDQYFRRDR